MVEGHVLPWWWVLFHQLLQAAGQEQLVWDVKATIVNNPYQVSVRWECVEANVAAMEDVCFHQKCCSLGA